MENGGANDADGEDRQGSSDGDGRPETVVDHVASVLGRLGGEATADRTDDRDQETGRPVTDGGADGAAPGDGPWAEDDPIVFGEEDSDHGTAILDAVTDHEPADDRSAPPFGSDAGSSDAVGSEEESDDSDESDDSEVARTDSGAETRERDADDSGIDAERIDELEARIGALETDHVQLEAGLTDVANELAAVDGTVETVGADVRQLVALLGGIALATDREAGEAEAPVEAIASAIEEEIDLADVGGAASGAATSAASAAPDASGDGDADSDTAAVSNESVGAAENGGTSESGTAVETGVADDPADGDGVDESEGYDDIPMPDELHRGVGDPPREAAIDDTDVGTGEGEIEAAPEPERSVEPSTDDATTALDDSVASPEDSTAASDDSAARPDDSARELVDPRTDAVSARLRQFREGFVDDPTADLPTGRATDEFRFEKILLPTDGDAAPDLSNAELAKPYLASLPDGYAADAVVLEWLDWLVSAADVETAARAVAYYESVEWITADVREELFGYLDGLGEPTTGVGDSAERTGDSMAAIDASNPAVEPPEALDLQDHLRSLQYVTELASGEVGTDGI